MTNKELIKKIRREIERRRIEYKEEYEKYSSTAAFAKAAECVQIIKFLDTLPVEAPEGLDEAIDLYIDNWPATEIEKGVATAAFKAGAEWAFAQGQVEELTVESPILGPPMICCPVKGCKDGDKVIIQIRKKR